MGIRVKWIAGFLLLSGILQAAEIEVRCPAVEHDERPRTNMAFEAANPVVLVVKGTVIIDPDPQKPAPEPASRRDEPSPCRIAVAEVVEGDPVWEGKTLPGFHFRKADAGKKVIVALAHRIDQPGFEWRYCHDSWQVRDDQFLLGKARLQWRAARADAIVVARDVGESTSSRERTIEVNRSILGDLEAGRRLRVNMHPAGIKTTVDKTPLPGDMLYLLEKPASPWDRDLDYIVLVPLLPKQSEEVLAARRAVEALPVHVARVDGRQQRYRLIGSDLAASRAVNLLGSDSEGARVLGQTRLGMGDAEARREIQGAIDAHLLAMAGGDHAVLKLLIGLCADETWEEDRATWTESILAAIETGAPGPEERERLPRNMYWTSESRHEDVNHALTWLLQTCERQVAARRYGERLAALRDRAGEAWQREIDLAFEEGGIRHGWELNEVERTKRVVRPPRAAAGHAYGMALSQDGKHLAVLGYPEVKVFALPGFEEAASFPKRGGFHAVSFIKDDRELLMAGGGPGQAQCEIRTWRTGNLISRPVFEGEDIDVVSAMTDDCVLLARWSRADDPQITLWDLKAHKARWQHPDHTPYQERPWVIIDATRVLLRDKNGARTLVGPGGERHPLAINPEWVVSLGGNGKVLVRLDGTTRIAQVGPDGEFALGTVIAHVGHKPSGVSPDGSLVAVEDPLPDRPWSGRDLVIVDTRSGTEAGRIVDPRLDPDEPLKNRSAGSEPLLEALFIPGTTLLVLGKYGEASAVFDWKSGKPASFPNGHQGEVAHAAFIDEGTRVLSVGLTDHELRVWDGTSLELLEKRPFPHTGRIVASHPRKRHHVVMRLDPESGVLTDSTPRFRVIELGADVHPVFSVPEDPWHKASFHFPNDRELIAVSDRTWTRIDFRRGKTIDRGELSKEDDWWNFTGEALREDGAACYRYGGGGKTGTLALAIQPLDGGKPRRLGEIEPDAWLEGDFHLVPDGKHAAWGGWIFKRDPFRMVARRRFYDADLLAQRFAGDGSVYVVAEGKRIFAGRRGIHDDQRTTWIRRHETMTGKTLDAWRASRRWVNQLELSPDGRRVLVVYGDGTLELLQHGGRTPPK